MKVAQLQNKQDVTQNVAALRPSVWVALALVTLSVYLPYIWLPFSSQITTVNDVQSVFGLLVAPGIIPNVLTFKGLFDRATQDAMGLSFLFFLVATRSVHLAWKSPSLDACCCVRDRHRAFQLRVCSVVLCNSMVKGG